ncbi:hypothetical protein BDZ89DRAFT_1046768 [Hymenopellis radicata]|nr:hypothetical protein BDZ89DRAFT_1046768 [Hymenopellis radicata]
MVIFKVTQLISLFSSRCVRTNSVSPFARWNHPELGSTAQNGRHRSGEHLLCFFLPPLRHLNTAVSLVSRYPPPCVGVASGLRTTGISGYGTSKASTTPRACKAITGHDDISATTPPTARRLTRTMHTKDRLNEDELQARRARGGGIPRTRPKDDEHEVDAYRGRGCRILGTRSTHTEDNVDAYRGRCRCIPRTMSMHTEDEDDVDDEADVHQGRGPCVAEDKDRAWPRTRTVRGQGQGPCTQHHNAKTVLQMMVMRGVLVSRTSLLYLLLVKSIILLLMGVLLIVVLGSKNCISAELDTSYGRFKIPQSYLKEPTCPQDVLRYLEAWTYFRDALGRTAGVRGLERASVETGLAGSMPPREEVQECSAKKTHSRSPAASVPGIA